MLKGILFDLDGTLLDIRIDAFLERYFEALERTVDDSFGQAEDTAAIMQAVMSGTSEMMRPHPGETNRQAFYREFERATGLDLATHWPVFERFYSEVFPTLQGELGPRSGAREALEAARRCGLKVALATNPIFPRSAIEHRLSWAGFAPDAVDVITDYETMQSCKPSATYFRQTAEMLGIDPRDCLMVGDDRVLDLAAADVGMRTFYVGEEMGVSADYRGELNDLASLLTRTCLDTD
ncbi:MAG: HAD family hydrolase [Coriobacteriia bacterium]